MRPWRDGSLCGDGVPTGPLNGVLAACDRARQPEVALALLESMRSSRKESAPPSVVSYSTALAALGRRPSLVASDKAAALLSSMRSDGLEPRRWPGVAMRVQSHRDVVQGQRKDALTDAKRSEGRSLARAAASSK